MSGISQLPLDTLLSNPIVKHIPNGGRFNLGKGFVQGFLLGEIEQTTGNIQSKLAKVLLEYFFGEERINRRMRGEFGHFTPFKLLRTVIRDSELRTLH